MAFPTSLSPREVRKLYKDLLHHAKAFPSIKRASIIVDIKEGEETRGVQSAPGRFPADAVCRHHRRPSFLAYDCAEFREKAKEQDPKKVAHAIEVGLRGLDTLRKYTGGTMAKDAPAWKLELEQDPLGGKIVEQRRAEQQAAEAAKLNEEKRKSQGAARSGLDSAAAQNKLR